MAAPSLSQQFQCNDRCGARFEGEDGITSGDYLQGFLRGTAAPLREGTGINHEKHSGGAVI